MMGNEVFTAQVEVVRYCLEKRGNEPVIGTLLDSVTYMLPCIFVQRYHDKELQSSQKTKG